MPQARKDKRNHSWSGSFYSKMLLLMSMKGFFLSSLATSAPENSANPTLSFSNELEEIDSLPKVNQAVLDALGSDDGTAAGLKFKPADIQLQDTQLTEYSLSQEKLDELITDLDLPSSESAARRSLLTSNLSYSHFIKAWGGSGVDVAHVLTELSDGSLAIAGYTNSIGAGDFDVVLMRVNGNGSLNWARTWGGAGGDYAFALTELSDGSLAVAGSTQSVGVGGSSDLLLLHVNANGNLNWARTWGGTDVAYMLTELSDGSLAIVGQTNSVGAGNTDALLLNVNASGSLNWVRTWGGSSNDYAYAVTELSDSSLAVAGETNSVGAGGSDVVLLHMNASGSLNWARTWGGAGNERVYAVTELSDGSLVVAGETNSVGTGSYDTLILHVNASGNLNWARTWGGAGNERARSLIELSDGSLAVAGRTESLGTMEDALLLRVNASGSLNWARSWGGANNDYVRTLTELSDGSLAVAGYTESLGVGGADALLMSVTAAGYAGEPGLVDWPSIIETDVTSNLMETVATTAWSNSNPGISLVSQTIDMVDITNKLNETLIAAVPSPSPTPSGTSSTTLSVTPSSSFTSSATPSPTPSVSASESLSASASMSANATPSTTATKSSSVTASQSVVLSSETSTVTTSLSSSISASPSISALVNTSTVTVLASPTLTTLTSTVTDSSPSFSPVNEAPVLVNNTLNIIRGQSIVLTPTMLGATDKETPVRNLEFSISLLAYGKFRMNPQVEVTVFSQGAVMDGKITFAHDGSANQPFYQVAVSDGSTSTEPETVVVQFNSFTSAANSSHAGKGLFALVMLHSFLQLLGLSRTDYAPNNKPKRLSTIGQQGLFAIKESRASQGLEILPSTVMQNQP